MPKIREFLVPDAYRNYRNVRAAALMFVVLGSILVLAGIALVATPEADAGTTDPPPKLFFVSLAIVGLAGAVGGVAVIRAKRKWAGLIYVMAVLYVLAFPLGTILSIV